MGGVGSEEGATEMFVNDSSVQARLIVSASLV